MTSDPYSDNPGVCSMAECWCTVTNPHTPPAPVTSSNRPGAGEQAKLRQRWGRWTERTWKGMTVDLADWYVNSLNQFPDYQAAYTVDRFVVRLYVRRVLP